MSQPPQYTRATSFADDERNNTGGRSTVRTAQVDAELDALALTANQTATNLGLIQRDDGQLRDQIVTTTALGADVVKLIGSTGGTLRGAWLTGTAYAVRDWVTSGGNTYACATAHTSGTFATDLAAAKWMLVQLGASTGALSITFTPTATLAATTVQAAIDEADTENRALSAAALTAANAAASSVSTLSTNLAANTGPGLMGLDLAAAYAANTAGWGIRTAQSSYNALRHVTPSLWAAILNGTSSDDHTAAIIAANSAALAAGVPLYLPGKRWNYTPTAPLETKSWQGDGKHHTAIYVNCAAYTAGNVVFRNIGGVWRGLTVRESSLSKTRGIMLQLSDTTALTGAGGALTFTGYLDLQDVWVFGGLVALDIGNVFTCTFVGCRFNQAGTGVQITPANDASDNGYANTLQFLNCEIADNTKNVAVNATGGKLNSLQFIGGSIERATTSSTFVNVAGLTFEDTYLEQSSAVSPLTITGCTGVYLKANTPGINCDITLGSNTEIVIEGWSSGSNHLLGADATQTVTIRNSTFPATANSAPGAFAKCTIENSSYNGKAYGYRSTAQRLTKPTGIDTTIGTVASAATIAITDPITTVSGTAAISTITAPPEFEYGGQITLLPSGAWTLTTSGNILLASTAVVGKAMTLTYNASTARWYPSY